ncbi:MAG: HAMP domain-containing protein [Geobacter sp.]|nr:HAMP domain-containing protein [Geobacter sp.]
MFFRSIRFRLTLWYAVTIAVVLCLFSSFLYVTFRKELFKEVDEGILLIAESLADPTLEPFRSTASSAFEQVLEDFIGPKAKGKYVQLLDSAGKRGAHSENLRDFSLSLSGSAQRNAREGEPSYEIQRINGHPPLRVINYPVLEDGKLKEIVQVGASLASMTDDLDRILLVLVVSVPGAVMLLSCGGWFLAGRALHPVELITNSAQKINAENLSHRLAIVNPEDEIGRLAQTFNDTLARLEESFTKIKQFSADVSHELRTPLTILRGEMEVALRWAKEPDEFRTIIQSNLEEVKRMSDMMEALLELAKADAGKLPLDRETLDLNEIFAELLRKAQQLGAENGVEIFFEPVHPLPVSGDRARLRQLFLNLLDNAVKYTNEGGEVRIDLAAEQDRAVARIADTGIGMPPEALPFVFDRFYRVDKSRNRADGGVGLGLAIVKILAELHGGTVAVASEPGMGSVFTVTFPLSPDDDAEG